MRISSVGTVRAVALVRGRRIRNPHCNLITFRVMTKGVLDVLPRSILLNKRVASVIYEVRTHLFGV